MTTESEDSTSALPTNWSAANEKRCEEGGDLPRKGKKRKRVRRVLAEAASAEEVEMALVGRAAGSLRQRKVDTLIQVFEKQIGDLLEAVRTSSVEIRDAIVRILHYLFAYLTISRHSNLIISFSRPFILRFQGIRAAREVGSLVRC